MRKIKILIILVFLIINAGYGADKMDIDIVGYIPTYRILKLDTAVCNYITDIIFIKIPTDSSGNIPYQSGQVTKNLAKYNSIKNNIKYSLYLENNLKYNHSLAASTVKMNATIYEQGFEKIQMMKEKYGIRTYFSTGGWWSNPDGKEFKYMMMNDSSRHNFVENAKQLCEKYNLDGVDLDYEHPQTYEVKEMYGVLMQELKAKGLIVTTALGSWGSLTKTGYDAVDNVYAMNYGATSIEGFNTIKSSMSHFQKQNVENDKIFPGLALWGDQAGKVYLFKDIVENYDISPEMNSVDKINFIGEKKAKNLVKMVFDRDLGGIMMFELGQDNLCEKSRIKVIYETAVELSRIAAPLNISVKPEENFGIKINFNEYEDANGYRLYWSKNPGEFSDSTDIINTEYTISGLDSGLYYLQIKSIDENNDVGRSSRVMAATSFVNEKKILIVNNFEIFDNPSDLIKYHVNSFIENGFSISSTDGDSLNENSDINFDVVDWIEGDNGNEYNRALKNRDNKQFIESYLQSGGNLIISGANISRSLFDGNGSWRQDSSWVNKYLKVKNILSPSAPNKKQSTYFTLTPGENSPFDLIGDISIGNGIDGCYKVYDPDGIYTTCGGSEIGYSFIVPDQSIRDKSKNIGLVYYKGKFDGSENDASLIFSSIPLETIYPDSKRDALFNAIISYFESMVAVDDEFVKTSNNYVLGQNYPNPFNPTTTINFQIPVKSNIKINIYDISGKLIEILVDKQHAVGSYEISWDANDRSSGIYFYQLIGDKFCSTHKMLLVK